MFVTMRDHRVGLARRTALLALVALTTSQLIRCAPLLRTRVPTEPPPLHKSARQLTRPELVDYLDAARLNKRRIVFRGSPADFQNGIANRRQRPAVGGGLTSVAIMPENGNFRIDTRIHFAPARGRVVAKIVNEGPGVDSGTGLARGDTAYWFIERDSTPDAQGNLRLRSLIILATNARLLRVHSLEVCHPPPAKLHADPKADFVDPVRYCGLPATPPPGGAGMGSSIDVARVGGVEAFSAEWIPCDASGCCVGR
jgi:hypothetical protein